MENKTTPYPGVLDLLRQLRSDGYMLAIVSNKFDTAVKNLTQTYFDGLISVAVGEARNVARKPAPDTVFDALRELGATVDSAIYVGDSDVDIDTAHNAGIPCISVSWGFRTAEALICHGAEKIVTDTQALYHAICSPD